VFVLPGQLLAIDFIMEAVGGALTGIGVLALTGHPILAAAAGAAGKYAINQIVHHLGLTHENAYHVTASTVSSLASHYHVIRSEMGSGMAEMMRHAESLDARPRHDLDSVYLSLRALDRALHRIDPKDLGDEAAWQDEPRNERGEWTAGGAMRRLALHWLASATLSAARLRNL
jgi:hypothetical protein